MTAGKADNDNIPNGKDCYDATKECQNATTRLKDLYTATGVGVKTWKTANTDAECTAINAANCRDATTGVAGAMDQAKSWKTATNAECLAMVSGKCRCADKTQATGTRKNDTTDVDCTNDFPDCFDTMTLASGSCRLAISG